jgi:hypothetical protein
MTASAQISELFHIQNRFLRSAHLERDFADAKALKGYVLTPQTQSYVERLATGLSPASGQRAWRITGDFGSGKSSFALLIAHLFSGKSEGLPQHLRQAVNFKSVGAQRPQLLPVLVTGSREPLAVALMRSLHRDLLSTCGRGRIPAVIDRIQTEIDRAASKGISDDIVVKLISEANAYLTNAGKARGLLIILDELGKFLEYAALHPDRQDVFLLQNLAESASRSGKTPLFVVGLLHQGFNAYADQLSQSAQKEWEKVAGRFEELLFNQPLEQAASLVADALNIRTEGLPRSIGGQARRDMTATLELGWYGAAFAKKTLLDNAERLYPLHSTVLPVLVKLFSRFGQNERSLFSFLLSTEPYGLQDFAQQSARVNRFYRIHNLYDYAKSAFGHRLSVQSYRSHWNQIDSMIDSFPAENELDLCILKTVGLLNLLDSSNLLASDETVTLAVAGKDTAESAYVSEAVRKLQKEKRVLYHRGAAGGYCLWPHTSVNLEKAYSNAARALGPVPQRVSSLIRSYLETRPLVARRHYIETGNLRHFEVRFSPVTELQESLKFSHDVADGVIIVALCETEEERQEALKFATSGALDNSPEVLFAIPNPLNILAKLLQEVQRWEMVAANTPELNNDSFASEEVSRQIAASRRMLEERIHSFIGLQQFTGRTELLWFRRNESLAISNGRALLSYLSNVCDEVYSKAPKIQNELVNRRSLSSAAAAARTRLIEGIFSSSSKPYLGMDPDKKPPEMSIYLSVLQRGGLHREVEGGYALIEPDKRHDTCRIRPALHRIRQLLETKADSRVKVSEIFSELRRPPFGIRDGISPMLLAIFAILNEQFVAFYDNGAFMREMAGLDLMRLTKVPEVFEIQYCKIAGVRSELFDQLFRILELKPSNSDRIDLLDIVRPLCVFAAQLPPYTHKTKRLSDPALAVRSTLLNAKEPSALLFRDLPQACGFAPFGGNDNGKKKEVEKFVETLKVVLNELRMAHPVLLNRMRESIAEAFDNSGDFQSVRNALSGRSENILIAVSEPRLKAFCMRLIDCNLPEAEWLESLGSLVSSLPPSKWTDAEEEKFVQELSQLVSRFKRVESLAFTTNKKTNNESAVRVTITQLDGSEVDNVIYVSKDEEKQVAKIEAHITSLLKDQKRIGLAATARAFWKAVSQSEESINDKASSSHPEFIRG